LHLIVHRQLVLVDATPWSCIDITCANMMQLPSGLMLLITSCDLESLRPHHNGVFRWIVSIDYFDWLPRSIILINHCNRLYQSIILNGCIHVNIIAIELLDYLHVQVSSRSNCLIVHMKEYHCNQTCLCLANVIIIVVEWDNHFLCCLWQTSWSCLNNQSLALFEHFHVIKVLTFSSTACDLLEKTWSMEALGGQQRWWRDCITGQL
jgi:hypothetical protein